MRVVHRWTPKKFSFKRQHKGVIKRFETRLSANRPSQGELGIRLLKSTQMRTGTLEQIRRSLLRLRKKREKQRLWFSCLADTPVTSKSLGFRMGKGKGAVKFWITKLPAGKLVVQSKFLKRYRDLPALRRLKRLFGVPITLILNAAFKRTTVCRI